MRLAPQLGQIDQPGSVGVWQLGQAMGMAGWGPAAGRGPAPA